MLRSGHYGAALLLYAPAGWLLSSVDPALALVGGAGAVGLSRLPDCDRRVSFIAHRGPTHSLAFLALVAATLGALGHVAAGSIGAAPARTAGLGVLVGVLAVGSHLLADGLTPRGVVPLWPLSRRRCGLSLVVATDPLANLGLFCLGVAATVAVGYDAGVV